MMTTISPLALYAFMLTLLASASPVPGDRDLREAPVAMRRRKLSFEAQGPGRALGALRAQSSKL